MRYPNEDSLAFEFSDANLFSLNRFNGIDRLEGGVRAAVGLRGSWLLGPMSLDGMFGQSYRSENTNIFPVGSGLNGTVSDYVGRISLHPAPWLDLTYRTRLDKDNLALRMADVLGSVGDPNLRFTLGYLYTNTDPFTQYDQAPPLPSAYYVPRNEITIGVATKYDQWRFSGYARRDIQTNQMVSVGADLAYENECFIFDARFSQRYTSFNGDNGGSYLLLSVTFKTVGQFGYHAL